MVNGSIVYNDLKSLDNQFQNYRSTLDELSSSWEGISHDSLLKQVDAFLTEYTSVIEKEMSAFKEAADLYVNYEAIKKDYNTALSNYHKAVSYDDTDNIQYYQNLMNHSKSQMDNLCSQISEQLSIVSGTTLKISASVSSLAPTTAESNKKASIVIDDRKRMQTSISNQDNYLGDTSGTLENARLGSEGTPKAEGYFAKVSDGGKNPFPSGRNGSYSGNCTFYAYGRFSELIGETAEIPTYDACLWWPYTTKYEKGQEPRLGAIAVWQYGNSWNTGHVAIVEAIDEYGNIYTSEGGYGSNTWYTNKTYYKSNGYATGYNNAHLLGFIYPEEV